jgi:hypothetical protein
MAQYHDDPIETAPAPSRRPSGFIKLGFLFIVGALFFQTTLAANINLGGNQRVEFGQGVLRTTACSGATSLTITPYSSFVNASGAGAFYFSSVKVSNIPNSCYGDDFTIKAFGNTSSAQLAIFNTASTNAVVYNNAGTFQLSGGPSGISITSGSGTFTITFTNPVALATSVSRITIESGAHSESASTGVIWNSRASAADNYWYGVTYGNGTFVAVAASGSGNRVMTSPDGITWTSRTSASDNNWYSVTYGNGTFVAVADSGSGNRVMTSTP